jgi:hypothetical protein
MSNVTKNVFYTSKYGFFASLRMTKVSFETSSFRERAGMRVFE